MNYSLLFFFCPNVNKREIMYIKDKYPKLYSLALSLITMCDYEASLIHNNWYVATGFNMWGFSWAMASSFILADMIEGKIEETFLNPNRWFLNKQLFINFGNTLINMVNFKKPRCTHLGVALKRNKVDRTWECPAHGSRFDELGNVINNPAKKNSNSKSFK